MFRRTFALAFLLVIPSIASAQSRGGGGGKTRGDKEANWNEIEKGAGAGLQLSNKDVENISPIKLVIEKRKDLKLSDAQTQQVKDLESKLNEKNDPFYKTLDSLRGVLKSFAGKRDMADEDRARMMLAREAVGETLKGIRDNYDGTLKEALALLDASQQKAATELVEKQQTEAEDMLREKLGGGGSTGGAPRRGRPPTA